MKIILKIMVSLILLNLAFIPVIGQTKPNLIKSDVLPEIDKIADIDSSTVISVTMPASTGSLPIHKSHDVKSTTKTGIKSKNITGAAGGGPSAMGQAVEVSEPHGFITSYLTIQNAHSALSGEYKCTSFSPLFVSVTVTPADEVGANSCFLRNSHSPAALQKCWAQYLNSSSDTENTKLLYEGYPIQIECPISKDKKDKPQLNWFKNDEEVVAGDHYKVFPENSTLYIPSPKLEDVGVYRCQTIKTPPVSFNISIIYITYKSLPKSITVLQGDKLAITCEVEGNPMPTVVWTKDDVSVEEAVNASHFALEVNEKGTPNATLVISNAMYEDRAHYTCFIATSGVKFNTTTYVRIKDVYAALWPFLGICAEVIILCLIIFIYEKRRAKNDIEESDTDQPPEQQKNKSGPNKDIRQRK